MDILTILGLIEGLTQIMRNNTSGGAQHSADNALFLEDLARKTFAAFQAETGQPMDLAKLQPVPVDQQQS